MTMAKQRTTSRREEGVVRGPTTHATQSPSEAPHGNTEAARLALDAKRKANWKRWGPYLSERQWGTVREDYSPDGSCWTTFPHDHARSRAYRWGEDGLLGICDRECRMCFAFALWNGKDPILKERLFGLTGPEGNHGEDVKEHYFFLESSPTHAYMRAMYVYPQAEYPYTVIVRENAQRGRHEREFEAWDTGVYDESRVWEVETEYAKHDTEDICVRLHVHNRGPERAEIHVLPTLWFRNTWSWNDGEEEQGDRRPSLRRVAQNRIDADHATLGRFTLRIDDVDGAAPELLFTENNTNARRLWGAENESDHVKDGFHERVIHAREDAVNEDGVGTKGAAWFRLAVDGGASITLRLRLTRDGGELADAFGESFEKTFADRQRECREHLRASLHAALPPEHREIATQANAGLLWSKQFYHYVVKDWLRGDRLQPAPPRDRRRGRNAEWTHLFNRDVISMPDTWEYPWYAAWDLAFHMLPMSRVDPHFAKEQLILMLREWYMHPNGQIPAYEFALGDVNPPVHAWACWRVYKMTGKRGQRDRLFLARVFQKLMLNFTWWVNRKDPDGRNLFAGGFLGLDNIGVFDRSKPLPMGHALEQADGTAWMAFYCGAMLSMALELAREDPAYEDVASKFFEHFVAITDAINTAGGAGLWDEQDGFYYDRLLMNEHTEPLRVRSLVGIVPMLAVEVLENDVIDRLPGFKKRMQWFLDHRQDLPWHSTCACAHAGDPNMETGSGMRLLAIPTRDRLERLLQLLLDENEFLSPYGIRSISRYHEQNPYVIHLNGTDHRVEYTPGESTTGIFGGNSNWRGPIWFPLNFLIIEALERYDHFYGDTLTVECPARSGKRVRLSEAASEIRRRLIRLFTADEHGHRPCLTDDRAFAQNPRWKDLVLFHEHFHPETGRGLGASHQTGWTALITLLLEAEAMNGDRRRS